jgi:dihydrofolate synthase/folylpolyglutamate synthase
MKRKCIPAGSINPGFIVKNGDLMNYESTLSYIMNQLPMYQRIGKLAYRTGLNNTLMLDEYFGHPHRKFKTIHIAGTNGKGSVSHMLASILQEAGLRVGLYTSPHLVDFRERIRVNGKKITKHFIAEFISNHKSYFETFDPSFFEISVFMAFEYFLQNQVDVAVTEVGLGGRLDATNIIHPLVSVITNIGKDHTEILGDTLEKIAAEKAGIIKKHTPVVIGETQPETLPVFSGFCERLEAPMIVADQTYGIDYSMRTTDGYQVFNIRHDAEVTWPNLKCPLMGHYQRKNTLTVLAAMDQISRQLPIQKEHVYAGIRNVVKNTGLSGRWQIISANPLVICDTAHNTEGIKVVMQQIKETPYKKLHLLLGFVNDKDIQGILNYLPVEAEYYFTRLSVPRTMNENELGKLAEKSGLTGKTFNTVKEAFEKAKEEAGRDDLIMITGSNFLVADFLEYKGKNTNLGEND